MRQEGRQPNRLINEKSPYLLQHAYNPVDWYPWGEEAFEKAKKENKAVFVSIGYSTCHWCHVMERESFEDQEVADLLNNNFISIKVDREERPDIDSIYMTVCQMLTGQGGWPLNVFLTPEQKPFYAGTYFPKTSYYGRPGMLDVLPQIHEKYLQERENIENIAEKITASLKERSTIEAGSEISDQAIHKAYQEIVQSFDSQYGGFGEAPKFPMPHELMFLLRYYYWSGTEQALTMVEKTLEGMTKGGIYDHIGGGFARYSTDNIWLVPHFEKMLYDNALLLYVLTEYYQITKDERWKRISYEVVNFLKREMTNAEGAFYSAIDADSEGMEGKYYIWSRTEILNILDFDLGELFCDAYDITEEGNFEGLNIPNLIHTDIDEISKSKGMTVDQVLSKLDKAKELLLSEREKRVYPHLDDKILTSWNALMAAALAKAGGAFHEPIFLEYARKSLDFIETNLWKNDQLYARYRDGEVKFTAYLDDYSFLLWAYLEMYEAEHNVKDLQQALKMKDHMTKDFWDTQNGGFFFTTSNAESLIHREKQSFDGALPSGNSVAALQLWKLAKYLSDFELAEIVDKLLAGFQKDVNVYPTGMLYMLQAVIAKYVGGQEVVVSGSDNDQAEEFLNRYHTRFHPFNIIIIARKNLMGIKDLQVWVEKIDDKHEFVVYVCEQYTCKNPIYSLEKAMEAISF
ncbi:thioredoxin domain-containing protein [Bacillus sp. FJAT-49736]|uniref:thioredoxin domain-containing protein n=1 Tax=Bacillus sp. FJAT-49736 TaxID=2833582 RepID=UPI001BC90BF5|nr:thioredoxin domain-containing protein [Bacillus sp. FJAT-49736]MBS4173148.1 thioredoxin domain-containing protein [Bacillus sp. FJAT-49736]